MVAPVQSDKEEQEIGQLILGDFDGLDCPSKRSLLSSRPTKVYMA